MHMRCFCPFSSGYTFHEAHGVAPVKIETNYPDVVSILMPRDLNGTRGTHERFVLQVCHGTRVFLVNSGILFNSRTTSLGVF